MSGRATRASPNAEQRVRKYNTRCSVVLVRNVVIVPDSLCPKFYITRTTPTFKALEKIMAKTSPTAIVCVGMAGKLARLVLARAMLQSCFNSHLSIRIWKDHIHAKNQLLPAFKT